MFRILHVDDCREDLALTKHEVLRSAEDFEIEWSESGAAAMELIRTKEFDCILSDYQMPEMDGLELLTAVREEQISIPFIMLTGQGNEEVAAEALRVGADDYFTKEIGIAHYNRLINSIRRVVGAYKEQAERIIAERRYRAMFENINDGVAVYEAIDNGNDFVFKDFNKVAEETEKIRREELIGRSVREVFPGVEEFGLFEVLQRVWRTGEPEHHPSSLYSDGRIEGWRENYVYKLPSEEAVAIYRDITKKVQAKEALQELEERWRSLAAHSSETIYTLDRSGKVLFVNRPPLDLSATDIVGKPIFDFVAAESRDRVKRSQDKVFKTGKPDSFDIPLLGSRGRRTWFSVHIKPIRGSEGINTALLITNDVTMRKWQEEKQKITIEILKRANTCESSHEVMQGISISLKEWLDFDAVGIRLQEGNDYPYFETTGFSTEFVKAENYLCAQDEHGEILLDKDGRPVLECMCGNIIQGRFDPHQPFFSANGSFWTNSTTDLLASTSESERQGRTRNRCHADGYESVALIPLQFGEKRYGLIQLNDKRKNRFTPELISHLEEIADQAGIALAQRRAEEKLREQQLLLEERNSELAAANEELEAFSYSISHDLRSPLSHIEEYSKILYEDFGDSLEKKGKHFLQRIASSCRKMNQLINDLLRLSRAATVKLRIEPVDLSSLAKAAVEELRLAEPDRQVSVEIAGDLTVQADAMLMRIALENLIGNAWKFTQKRKQGLIEFGVEETEGERIFYVKDNGVGFHQEDADKLFAPFQRLHTESEFSGTGVGLATVQRIINRHGGQIWGEGNTNKGAVFYFTLG